MIKASLSNAFSTNGKLVIERCDIENVRIFKESKEAGTFPVELGFCPLIVEDFPGGKYTLIFKHDERDTLLMDIETQFGRDNIIKLKEENENNYLSDILLNRMSTEKIYENPDGIFQKADPVYMEPGSSIGRAHFYAPFKKD